MEGTRLVNEPLAFSTIIYHAHCTVRKTGEINESSNRVWTRVFIVFLSSNYKMVSAADFFLISAMMSLLEKQRPQMKFPDNV